MAFNFNLTKKPEVICPVCHLKVRTDNIKLHIGRMAYLEKSELYTHCKHFEYRQKNLIDYNKITKTLWTK